MAKLPMNQSTYKTTSKSSDEEISDIHDIQYDVQLAANIIEARLKKNLTQAELANEMGILQPAIARAENGNTPPTHKLIKKIARALGAHLIPPRFVFQLSEVADDGVFVNSQIRITNESLSPNSQYQIAVQDHQLIPSFSYKIIA